MEIGNNKENALEFLEQQGCNLRSFIIDYGVIAKYLVKYANQVNESEPKEFDLIRNFIRTNHLTKEWEKFLEENS